MAELIPGFSQEDSDVLRQAYDVGRLTDEEKKWIIGQVDKANAAVGGDVSVLEPTQEPQPSFPERALGAFGTRDFASAIGGTAGTILGTATIPATGILGPIVGGSIGSAGGSLLFDNFTNLRNYLEGNPENIIGGREAVGHAVGEGITDAAFSMGGALAQPVRLTRMAIAKISGLNEKASLEVMRIAEEAGVRLGAVDVGGTFPKGYAKTIGVFPFSGTPFRTGQDKKIKEAEVALREMLDAYGPNEKLASEIGVDMYNAAKNSRQEFRNVADSIYKNLRESINTSKNPHIIPTNEIKAPLEGLEDLVGGLRSFAIRENDKARRGTILLSDGTFLPPKESEEIADFFISLAKLPDVINPTQYEALTKSLKNLIEKNITNGYDVKELSQAKALLRAGFDNLRVDLLPPGQGEAIQAALEAANTFYAKGIVKFQTPSAKIFERVNKFIFKAGGDEAGTLNADEIYRTAINLQSPEAIRDLAKLVGVENMQNAAAFNFRTVINNSRRDINMLGHTFSEVDPALLEKQLGLVGAGTKKLEGMKEFYKTAGIDFEAVTNLINVMKKIEGIGNPAEFMRRRIILGGLGAVTGAMGIGGTLLSDREDTMGAGLITAVTLTLLSRHGSKIFADPDKLKLLTGALDESRAAIPRRANLARLVNLMMNKDQGVAQTPLSEEVM